MLLSDEGHIEAKIVMPGGYYLDQNHDVWGSGAIIMMPGAVLYCMPVMVGMRGFLLWLFVTVGVRVSYLWPFTVTGLFAVDF